MRPKKRCMWSPPCVDWGDAPERRRTAPDASVKRKRRLALTSSARHVRDRSNPRSGRHVGPGRGGADGRGAAPPRSGWRRAEAHRAARAGPHAAGHHRRRGRRPAARFRGRPRDRDRQRRDLQPPRAAEEPRGARPPLGHELGQRGDRARVRGVRPRLRAAPQRHLRLRPLGRPRAAPRRRPGRLRREAALLVERRAARGTRVGDRRAAGGRTCASRRWTGSRSTTTSPAASCPRRGRSSRASRSCRRRAPSWWRGARRA